MINTKEYSTNVSYFAAANGYSGFRSLFGELFDSRAMRKIYVLKGGPGTGKSTILKGLLVHSEKCGYFREAIYCSSDPRSLDGVIISSNGVRIAVLDGTAPHERDAVIPGAIDEIINLGDGFDIKALEARRDEIMGLTEKKKAAYSRAYSHLKAAGAIWQDIVAYFENSPYYCEAELLAKELSSRCANAKSVHRKRRYTSAFGSTGYVTLRTDLPKEGELVTINADRAAGHIIMMLLYHRLDAIGAIRELNLSPFSDSIPERIITDERIFEVCQAPLADKARADAPECDKTLTELFKIHDDLLLLSKAEFLNASEQHFKLEDIYKCAVDFTYNDAIFERLTKSVDRMLAH